MDISNDKKWSVGIFTVHINSKKSNDKFNINSNREYYDIKFEVLFY